MPMTNERHSVQSNIHALQYIKEAHEKVDFVSTCLLLLDKGSVTETSAHCSYLLIYPSPEANFLFVCFVTTSSERDWPVIRWRPLLTWLVFLFQLPWKWPNITCLSASLALYHTRFIQKALPQPKLKVVSLMLYAASSCLLSVIVTCA